jgi:hypothetical protein
MADERSSEVVAAGSGEFGGHRRYECRGAPLLGSLVDKDSSCLGCGQIILLLLCEVSLQARGDAPRVDLVRAAKVCGRSTVDTTMGYAAIYPEDVIGRSSPAAGPSGQARNTATSQPGSGRISSPTSSCAK